MKIFFKLIFVILFVFVFLLLIFSSFRNSLTTDEGIHLYSGYTYLINNDFRLDVEHPPILKELAALPLIFVKDIKLPLNGLWDKAANFYYDAWQEARVLGENFLFSLSNNPDQLILLGRIPFIILTLLLGLAVFIWARKLYGQKAALLAAFLILLMPNILAHGILINTDLGLILFLFLGIYFWVIFLKKPQWPSFLLSGLFIGFALASKFTGLIVILILIILALVKLFFYDKNFKNWSKYLVGFAGILLVSFFVIWASYGFLLEVPPPPIASLSENVRLWTDIQVPEKFDHVFKMLRPIMFPAQYYKGLFLVGRHALAGHGSFLLGETSNTGWWYYFPVAIFYKTPIPFFIFLLLSLIFWLKLKAKESFDEVVLIVTALIFLLISMFSKADLGVRHVLPIFPFLAIYASKSINLVDFSSIKITKAETKKIIPALGFLILILWYLFSAVTSYPNYLTYFNEFGRGPQGGYKILVDSNLDWGQDIFQIKKYLVEHQISDGYILYPWNGNEALQYYGINLKPFVWDRKDLKGYVVVSATYLQLAELGWLMDYPYEQITPGVFIFNIE